MCHSLPLRMRPSSSMTSSIHRLLLLPTWVRDPFPVTPGHPALVTFLLLPIWVRDPFLVTRGLLALVTITILLLLHTRVLHLHRVFPLVMSPLGIIIRGRYDVCFLLGVPFLPSSLSSSFGRLLSIVLSLVFGTCCQKGEKI
jgi:hypothetical protein